MDRTLTPRLCKVRVLRGQPRKSFCRPLLLSPHRGDESDLLHTSTLLCQNFTHNMLCRQRRQEAATPASLAAQGDATQQREGMTQLCRRRACMHLAAKQPNPNYKAHSFQHTQDACPDRIHYLVDQPATATSCNPAVLQCITPLTLH